MKTVPEKTVRINEEIFAKEVRLIGDNNTSYGIVSLAEAIAKANELETDLVEIAPEAKPPVCRLMNYGKFKYAESKKLHEARIKQKQIQLKEVKFRPSTDEGDYKVKLRNISRFLEEGNKAKISLRFKGREITRQEFGLDLLKRIEADLLEEATVDLRPKMEGRQMIMILSPLRKKTKD